MNKKMLLGFTNENEVLFGGFEITTRNGYEEFTAQFTTVRPINVGEFDLESYIEDELDNLKRCDPADYISLLEDYDCSPSELAHEMWKNESDIREYLDCASYPEMITANGTYYVFETVWGGQHDPRPCGMKEIINEKVYNLLLELWDNYHLKEMDDYCKSQIKVLDAYAEMMDDSKELQIISRYVITYIE